MKDSVSVCSWKSTWSNFYSDKLRWYSTSGLFRRWECMDESDSFGSELCWNSDVRQCRKWKYVAPLLVNWNGQRCIDGAGWWLPISRHNVGLLLWYVLANNRWDEFWIHFIVGDACRASASMLQLRLPRRAQPPEENMNPLK